MQISVWSALQRWFSLGDITVVLALQVAAAACLTAVDVSTQATLATCSISSVTNFLTSPSGEHLLLRPGFAGTEGVKILSLPSLQETCQLACPEHIQSPDCHLEWLGWSSDEVCIVVFHLLKLVVARYDCENGSLLAVHEISCRAKPEDT